MKPGHITAVLVTIALTAPGVSAATLRVGISQNPPLKYTDPAGNHTGLFVELLKEAARCEGWSLTWRPGTFEGCLGWLRDGEIDVIPNIGFSYERSLQYRFGEQNVISTWAEVYARPGLTIGSLNELGGLSIAVQNEDVFVNDPRLGLRFLMSQFDMHCELREVQTYDDVLRLVESGQADAGIVNRLVGDVIASAYRVGKTGVVFYPVSLRFAFSKTDPRIEPVAETLDRYVAGWKEDPSSIYYQLIDRFYPVEKPRTIIGSALVHVIWRRYRAWIVALAVAIGLTVAMALRSMLLNRRLDKANKELSMQLQEIQTLQGLIPICHVCKRVKDDKGYWESVERYISRRSAVEFTHGICPACTEKHLAGQAGPGGGA